MSDEKENVGGEAKGPERDVVEYASPVEGQRSFFSTTPSSRALLGFVVASFTLFVAIYVSSLRMEVVLMVLAWALVGGMLGLAVWRAVLGTPSYLVGFMVGAGSCGLASIICGR